MPPEGVRCRPSSFPAEVTSKGGEEVAVVGPDLLTRKVTVASLQSEDGVLHHPLRALQPKEMPLLKRRSRTKQASVVTHLDGLTYLHYKQAPQTAVLSLKTGDSSQPEALRPEQRLLVKHGMCNVGLSLEWSPKLSHQPIRTKASGIGG